MKSQIVPTFALFLCVIFSFNIHAKDQGPGIYKDIKSYYIVVMPSGWKVKDYPAETIRSKVKFIHPKLSSVNIGIIAGPSPRQPYTIEDVLVENRGKKDQISRIAPDSNFTVKQKIVTGRDAVITTIERGGSKMETVTFIDGDIFFQITLNTGSSKDRVEVSSAFQKFLRSFSITKSGHAISDEDRINALISRYISLATLLANQGMTNEALLSVEEGLAVDPNNKELHHLHTKILGNKE